MAKLSNQEKVLEWEQGTRDEAVLLYLRKQYHVASLNQELQCNMMLESHAVQGNGVRPMSREMYTQVLKGE